MSEPPYRAGHFVWSAFPERENPARPGPRHIGYVALTTGSERFHAVFLAYTTSRLASTRSTETLPLPCICSPTPGLLNDVGT